MSDSNLTARVALIAVVAGIAGVADALGCASASAPPPRAQGEGMVLASIPPEHREEYALFAQRCSKCHSLARALNNGDRDEKYWALYVTRMRRQPSSGIAPADEPPILRFLNYHSAQLRAESAPDAGPSSASVVAVPSAGLDAGVDAFDAGQP